MPGHPRAITARDRRGSFGPTGSHPCGALRQTLRAALRAGDDALRAGREPRPSARVRLGLAPGRRGAAAGPTEETWRRLWN
ncbi:hypothetical protein [Streptomyces sp. FIT100]|uniref:hypothetical protein n=1 Tax=Streptomyces sp. FIT100 TaxID=2837956 RepID=UPI0021C66A3F|nr:hypothetical protein [Streptomyces sp. FIT100]UUN30907.1 hypothetical protein KK483_34675 [Streptomyces sp. FIT100]